MASLSGILSGRFIAADMTDSKREHIYGFAALMAGRVVGIVHVIEHDSCWTLKPYAYLQDLFTHEDYRGLGLSLIHI